jgi:hypothetical protein
MSLRTRTSSPALASAIPSTALALSRLVRRTYARTFDLARRANWLPLLDRQRPSNLVPSSSAQESGWNLSGKSRAASESIGVVDERDRKLSLGTSKLPISPSIARMAPAAASIRPLNKEPNLKAKRLKVKQSKPAVQDKILPTLEPLNGIRIPHPFDMLSPKEQRHVRETLDAMSRRRRLADTSKGSIRLS